jgi:hypothetical protein
VELWRRGWEREPTFEQLASREFVIRALRKERLHGVGLAETLGEIGRGGDHAVLRGEIERDGVAGGEGGEEAREVAPGVGVGDGRDVIEREPGLVGRDEGPAGKVFDVGLRFGRESNDVAGDGDFQMRGVGGEEVRRIGPGVLGVEEREGPLEFLRQFFSDLRWGEGEGLAQEQDKAGRGFGGGAFAAGEQESGNQEDSHLRAVQARKSPSGGTSSQ